jgi:PAS domain S-box-containing protein
VPESISPTPTAAPPRGIRGISRRPGDRRDDGLAEAILDSVVEAIVVFDPADRTIATANQGACDLLGRPREEIVGRSIDEFLRPSDAARVARLSGPVASGEREIATVMAEYQLVGGRSISVEIVLQRVRLPGGTNGIVAIARDVRDRIEVQVRLQRLAQAEHARAAELNAVIRAMGEAVVVCQADGTITLTNPASEDLFPGVEQRTFADILAQLHDPDELAPALGATGGPIELQTRADPERWVEIATYPVNLEIGLATGGRETIVVMRDVTDARQRELVRETFIGVLSHELRTPITTIFGGAKLLAREILSLDEETKRGIFRDIHDEAERLQRLVEDVVALNRFGEGRGEIGWEPVLLQRMVPRVVESEEGRWPGVSFLLDIHPGLPTVSADPTYVEQVIRNLLSNAAKYGGAGSTVTITTEAGEGEVIVRVLDDGPGFPADEASRLFELFYRSPGTATAAGGAGIGLFVCARLVTAMGGRIWATPRDDGGAEFGFALAELDEEAPSGG